MLAPADATGLAFTATDTVVAVLVQLAEVTVTEYDPLSANEALEMVNTLVALLELGPVHWKVGEAAPDEAVNVNDSPTHTLLSETTTVGAAGEPGFVTLYGPNNCEHPFPSVMVKLYVPAGILVKLAVVPTTTLELLVQL